MPLMPKRKRTAANPWPGKLVAFRSALGTADHPITQVAAAKLLGVSTSTVIAWENDQRRPSKQTAELLSLKYPKHF